jgi:peptidoglycan/LPS O-acetylase OafA/YrhL
MGTLRSILAIAVVVFHSYKIFGLRLCGGQVAVQSFYMISGFYMALVLNEKYTGKGFYKTFILSRFYRIFPVYWLVLLCAVLVSVVAYYTIGKPFYLGRYISSSDCLSPGTMLWFVLENIIVIGQDVLYFLKLDEFCKPEFVYNTLSFRHTGYQYLFVPQAWSISIECVFYLLAPFMVTKKIRWQLLIVLLSLALRYVVVTKFYLGFDPWTYRFFPFELAFFLAGSLAYRYYKFLEGKQVSIYMGYGLLIGLLALIALFDEIPLKDTLKNYSFYLLFLSALPYIFHSFKNNKADRYIGELSFSIYIVHHLVVILLRGRFFGNPYWLEYYGYVVIAISVLLAVVMQKWLVAPLDRYRHRLAIHS